MRDRTRRCEIHAERRSYDVTDGVGRCWPCYKSFAGPLTEWRAADGTRRGHNLRGPEKPVFRGPERSDWKGDAAPSTTKRMRAQRMYSLGDCERCGKKATDRHHVDGDTGNNVRANLMFLCRRCHMVVDGRLAALIAMAKAPRQPNLRPCANCSTLSPRISRGRCNRCASYFWAMGCERPSHLFSKESA